MGHGLKCHTSSIIYLFSSSTSGARQGLNVTLPLYIIFSFHCILCLFINSLVVLIIHLYIETQREVPFLPFLLHIYDHIDFENFYGLMVYFTTFCEIFNIFTYSNDWGGGLCGENIPIY